MDRIDPHATQSEGIERYIVDEVEEDGSRGNDMNAEPKDGPIDEDENHVLVDAHENGHVDNLIEDEGEVDQLLATAQPKVLEELEVVLEIDLFARRDFAQDAIHEEIDHVI